VAPRRPTPQEDHPQKITEVERTDRTHRVRQPHTVAEEGLRTRKGWAGRSN